LSSVRIALATFTQRQWLLSQTWTDGSAQNLSRIQLANLVHMGAEIAPTPHQSSFNLAQQGIRVVLIEKADELPCDLRASTFHPPTLDMLDELDLTASLISQGLIVREFQFRERATGEAVNFNLARISDSTNHPYRLQCEQYKLTRSVAERLERFDHVDIRMGSQVLGYREHSDGVAVLLFDGENELLIEGSFLVGTDGAGSRVRQASGTEFEGLTYPERFLVVSTDFPFEKHFPDLRWVNYVSDPDEWCVMLKTRDLWRIQFPTPIDMEEEELLSDSFIEDRLQRLFAKDGAYDINHRTLYKVHQRVAKTYRPSPHVLLAGDAAHVNNPLGGMGMNGGIHDAFNLGEKLVNILTKNAPMDSHKRKQAHHGKQGCGRSGATASEIQETVPIAGRSRRVYLGVGNDQITGTMC